MKVYQAVAQAIVDEGVEALFTLIGNANMELVASIAELDGPSIYQARIEGTAVGMAEGYARSSGKVGVAAVTSGPALANTTNALTSAVRAGTPLVLITGHPTDRDNHQHFHQQGLAELTGAEYFDVASAGAVLDVVRSAFYTARAEHRPVILDLGREVQVQDYEWGYAYEPSTAMLGPSYPMVAPPEALEAALAMIAESERPVVIAGAGAYHADAREEILELASEVGALLATSLHAKNWFTDEAFNLGVAGLFSWQYAAEIFAEADCVIGVGASLNHFTTEGGYLFPSARIVQIDTEPNVLLGTDRQADVFIRGDARTTVRALTAEVRSRGLGGTRFRSTQIESRIADGAKNPDPAVFDVEPDRADPRRVLEALDSAMPSPCGIAVGTGHSWGLSNMELKRWREPQLYSHAFGSIGIALPLCLGAAVAHPGRPFLHVEGDGSIMMTIHALDTLAKYQLPVLVVVLNDSAYSAEVHQLISKGISPDVAYLNDVDFAAVARAFGCRSAVVRNESDMTAVVEQFRADPGPFIADVRTSRQVVSVAFRRLHYGVQA